MMALVAMAIQACSQQRAEMTLQVKTQAGVVEGIAEDGIKKFLGVQFAAAPVGDLRWKAPQPVPAWEGVREAKAFGNDPMQPNIFGDMSFRGASRSEDCLYLNIWTPANYVDEGLPVLIYFNGGGLMAGSGSEPRYDGTAIAQLGVIGVTANYREGVFGFFAHPELTAEASYKGSGNYGFLDQVAAIQWVKDNIAAFGGDPNRINIVGESAGSFSTSLLMCSPLSKGNLAGVMGSSGAEVLPYGAVTQADADASGKQLLESKGVMSVAEARALSADSLQALFPPRGMANVVLDGYFMKESADDVFKKGEQAQVPLLVGWNSQEGTPMSVLRNQAPTLENYKKAMSATFGDMTDEIFKAYGLETDADVLSQKSLNLASDLFTGFPTWKWADYHAKTSKQPVYRYKYMHPRPQVSAKMGNMVGALAGGVREMTEEEKKAEAERPKLPAGAVHSADIEYAMGNLATNEYYDWQEEDYAISKLFLSYYANFCKFGNPNGEGLPTWTPINGQDVAPVMYIDVTSAEKADAATENAYRTLEKFYLSR
ncbi:MAG: carboxylesterase family protein [Bacteroidaceae bacterium]|nr:carboxylesterase family protein [Bacteroidaceae bacterium]MBR3626590.1 carboxylesterase family protein [Bacteroidaceae bacterium]